MNVLKTSAIGVLLSLCTLCAPAQENLPLNEPDRNKPQLFADMPQRMNLNVSNLHSLFALQTGASVNAEVADGFSIRGTVTSRSNDSQNSVQTVVIRAANRRGASFTFTRMIRSDGSVFYKGRILSFQNSDAYEIMIENGSYVLQKKNLYDLVSE
jgi:hypothetical protein